MKQRNLSPPDSKFLTVADLAALFDVHQQTIWNWVGRGKLPEPIKLSAHVARWRRADIDKIIDGKSKKQLA